ncbi:MAG: tRNA (guanine(10)-N(2))-dimethyltransferase [Candidatus Bathyarchaeia archaeon]
MRRGLSLTHKDSSPSPQTHPIVVVEGRARLQFTSHSSKVFYNPKMSLNRDLAILFTISHFLKDRRLELCYPMAGSGVRAVRYALETPNVASVVAADRQPDAAELARETVRLNKVEDKVFVIQSEAYTLLAKNPRERFDLIDLDPFGSPSPFFECALRATEAGGVLAATATDMGPLSGARPGACKRKYGVVPIRAEFEKEVALRTLVSALTTTAAKLELGINLAFSHATDHYARLYATVIKGRKAANESLRNLGFVTHCPNCLNRTTTSFLSSIREKCDNCGSQISVGGPFWLGLLWDRDTVRRMIQHTPLLLSTRLSEIQKILNCIENELDAPPFYYTTDAAAAVFRTKPPPISTLLASLRANGYQASRTHLNPTGFRTDAPTARIASLFRTLTDEP